MALSTHYYVLSLGARTNVLFEAFRDTLIDVENQGFPVTSPARVSAPADTDALRDLSRDVDRSFGHHYSAEPLRVVVVGCEEMQSAFSSVTAHGDAVVARVTGDFTATAVRDLGRIVWGVVKEAMSGALDAAMRDLSALGETGRAASGLDAVAGRADSGANSTLLVEDGYHVRGSLGGTTRSPVVLTEVDVRESMDDAVDAVIERLLLTGANVVFAPDGTLDKWDRIVLLLRDDNGS